MTILEAFWIGMTVHLWQTALFVAGLVVVAYPLRRTSARLISGLYWTGILKLLLPLPLLGPISDRLLAMTGNPDAGAAAAAGWGSVSVLMYPMLLDGRSTVVAGLPSALYVGLTAAWLAGVGLIVLRRLRRHKDPEPRQPDHTLERAISSAGLRTDQVRITPHGPGPHVRGGLRPIVVLPQTVAGALEEDELCAVLIHEREHLRRRDPLRYGLLALVRTAFWFYPPVWWLTRRILETTEMACDEAVVRAGLPAAVYCRSLARTVSVGLTASASPVGILGHRVSFLRRRLERIRSGGRFEIMVSHRLTVAAAALAALIVSVLPLTPGAPLRAGDEVLFAGEGLDGLAQADLPVMLNFQEAKLAKVLGAVGKTSGIEFRLSEELADKRITVDLDKTPLELALKHIGMVGGVAYRVIDPQTVEVAPVLLAGAEGVTTPVLIPESKTNPEYPEQAREDHIEGRVMLQAMIDSSGTVNDVIVLSSDPPDYQPFIDSAVAAISHWRYQPATKDGKPVDVYFAIRVEFKLDGDKSRDVATAR